MTCSDVSWLMDVDVEAMKDCRIVLEQHHYIRNYELEHFNYLVSKVEEYQQSQKKQTAALLRKD